MFASHGYGKVHANLLGLQLLQLQAVLKPTDAAREIIERLKRIYKRVEDMYPDNWLLSKGDSWEAGLLDLVFTNANFANLGDATGIRGSTTAGNVFLSLHTADPGETGNQQTNEATYTNYARVSVARAGGSWTRTGTAPTQMANAAIQQFPTCGASGNTVTHAGVGTATSGAGILLYSGALNASLIVNNLITPQYAIGAFAVTED